MQSGVHSFSLDLAGRVPGATGVLGVMDIGGAQQRFGRVGVLSRVDLKLVEGLSPQAGIAALAPLLPPGLALLGVLAGNDADRQRLAATLAQADTLMKRLNSLTARTEGLVVNASDPAEFDRYVKAEEARWRKIVKENNIKAD